MFSLLTSPVITVLAGKDKTPIVVHSAAFESSSSPVLKSLLSENWKEGQEKVVDWSHTDVSTVLRVVSYLYTKDYEVEILKKDEKDESTLSWQIGYELSFYGVDDVPVSKAEVTKTRTVPGTSINTTQQAVGQWTLISPYYEVERSFTSHIPDILGKSQFPPTRNSAGAGLLDEKGTNAKSDCGIIYTYLSAHAHVYIFAQSRLMPDLERLALERTSKVLQFAEKTSQPLEVLNIIDFVYENTAHCEADEEPLRSLLTHFVILNMGTMSTCDTFRKLLRGGGDFAADVYSKMVKFMHILKTETEAEARERAEMASFKKRSGTCRRSTCPLTRSSTALAQFCGFCGNAV